ncbi:MAG: Hsp70 family protein [Pseudomonadota bacterium]|nr:Hsp70 family protein [Pseudomonadota bacterium]
MPASCAIDFGTSNTTVALCQHGEVRQLAIDPASPEPERMPTLLYFPPEGPAVYGAGAVDAWLAEERQGRLIQSIKRYLPSSGFEGTLVGGTVMGIEALIGGFLAACKHQVDLAAGENVTRVILGRPAQFGTTPDRDKLAQDRLWTAARRAGFRDIGFQVEPVAAARSFERSLDRDVLCLVGDLGGGTSDFTVIKLGPGRIGTDRSGDVLGVAGVDIAGNDFDARIVYKKVAPYLGLFAKYKLEDRWVEVPTTLHHAVTRWHSLCHAKTDKNLRLLERMLRFGDDKPALARLQEMVVDDHGFHLFRAVEATKVALSDQLDTTLSFHAGSIALDAPMSRDELDAALALDIRELEKVLDGLLGRLELRPDDIDVVFLTGGTSRTLRVQRMFEERFPSRVVSRDVFTSIGYGLGIEAAERYAS